jgi:hypothetical protein
MELPRPSRWYNKSVMSCDVMHACRQLHLPESVSMSTRAQPRRHHHHHQQHMAYTFSTVTSRAESLPRLVPPSQGHMTIHAGGGASLDISTEPDYPPPPKEVTTSVQVHHTSSLHQASSPHAQETCHTSTVYTSQTISSPKVASSLPPKETSHTSSSPSLRVTSRAPKVTSVPPREVDHTPSQLFHDTSSIRLLQTVSSVSLPGVTCHASPEVTPLDEAHLPPAAHPLNSGNVREELLLMRHRMQKYLQLKIRKRLVGGLRGRLVNSATVQQVSPGDAIQLCDHRGQGEGEC